MEQAVGRRLHEELGLTCALAKLFSFTYQARFGSAGSEHEHCTVFVGRSRQDPTVNANEIDAWRWIDGDALDNELAKDTDDICFTPWFKIEWARLRSEYADTIAAL